MKIVKSEKAAPQDFDQWMKGQGKPQPKPAAPEPKADPTDGRATMDDIESGRTIVHPHSSDRAYKKNGKYFLEGGDMADMIADQKGIEWDGEGPLVVEVEREVLKGMVEEPDDPDGWYTE